VVELSPIFKEKLLEKIPLSVAIITKNEEENIRQCLQSITFAEQIVIIDSGSTDSIMKSGAVSVRRNNRRLKNAVIPGYWFWMPMSVFLKIPRIL
jgi:hypothetical protein